MRKIKDFVFIGIMGIAVVALLAAILGFPAMMLWNHALVGAVDGVNEISFLQAIGIVFLCGILFSDHSSKER